MLKVLYIHPHPMSRYIKLAVKVIIKRIPFTTGPVAPLQKSEEQPLNNVTCVVRIAAKPNV